MTDVVAIGELLVDFTQREVNKDGFPILDGHPGGAPANFLAALSSLGIATSLIAKVGNDSFGRSLINTLNKYNIDSSNVIVDDNEFTTLAFVTIDSNGEREFSFSRKPGADTRLKASEIDYSLIAKARVLHFGTLSLTDSPAKEATIKAIEYAKSNNKIISFDPNLRKPLWKSLDKAREAILYGLSQADIVKISDDELRFMFDMEPKAGIEHLFKSFNIKIAFVTCGENGVYFSNDGKSIGYIESLKGLNVVDTTGAGDIFGGTTLGRLLLLNKELKEINMNELYEAVGYGVIASGLSVEAYGGISSIPSLARIKKLHNND